MRFNIGDIVKYRNGDLKYKIIKDFITQKISLQTIGEDRRYAYPSPDLDLQLVTPDMTQIEQDILSGFGVSRHLIKKEEKKMVNINTLILDAYESKEAVLLVNKYFANELAENSLKDEVFIQENKKALLKKAQDLQAKEDKDLKGQP